jgi:nicotinate-nucleotide pyrophosphorylase (carboxylating)
MWTTAQLIAAAIEEDVGSGDLTSQFFVPRGQRAEAVVVARQSGVLAGSAVAADVFLAVDPSLAVMSVLADGDRFDPDAHVLKVAGSAASILTAERTALNFLQRLSGVATLTRRFVDAVAGTGVRILDTRKTTPGWRVIEKAAVRAGGGYNHRSGLHDMVLAKDNHWLARHGVGDVQQAIDEVRSTHPDVRIELEAADLDQVRTFLELEGVDVIMLDNMTLEDMRAAVELAGGSRSRVALEASGGVSLESVRAIAATGVDFISCGALTHSAPAVDLSLDLTHVA